MSEISFNIGDSVNYRLKINPNHQYFASFQEYFEFALIHPIDKDVVIYEEEYGEESKEFPNLKSAMLSILNFISCLKKNFYHKDDQIVMFNQTYCEIPLQVRQYDKYLSISKMYSRKESLIKTIKDFTDWINADISNSNDEIKKSLLVHETERNTIVATEIVSSLSSQSKNKRIFFLLDEVESIYQSTISRYGLYLNDFKFSKFNDKIAEHAEKLLEKANDIITSLQAQILAIPLAVGLVSISKSISQINRFLIVSFFIYALFVLFATIQQTYDLWNLRSKINNFVGENKIPESLQAKWENEIKPVKIKITIHGFYLLFVYILLATIIISCCAYLSPNWQSTLIDSL